MDKYQQFKSQIFEQESVVEYGNGDLDTSMESAKEMVGIFDSDEVKYKGKPIRGRRYLAFTVIMIILLSLFIIWTRPTVKKIEKELKYDEEHGHSKKDAVIVIEDDEASKTPVTKDDKPAVEPAADTKDKTKTDDKESKTTTDVVVPDATTGDDKTDITKTDATTKPADTKDTVPQNPEDASKVDPAASSASDDKTNTDSEKSTTDTAAVDNKPADSAVVTPPATDTTDTKPSTDAAATTTADDSTANKPTTETTTPATEPATDNADNTKEVSTDTATASATMPEA